MRMEQYLTFTDHTIWEVIVNGDPVSSVVSASAEGPISPKTAEQNLATKNKLKAKSTLMLAFLNEHLLKFHACKDAKSLCEVIKNRFKSNKESKNMLKTILKQNYKNFAATSQEELDKTYERFQKLISQLEIHGEVISQEDANLKLLRSLPLAWNNIALMMRNKSDLDTLSMDDFYNNLKVYKSEIKSQSNSSLNSHNVAFISLDNSSSTNETVNTAHSVFAANSKDQAFTTSYDDDVMFSFFSNQSNAPQLDNEDLEQIDTDDLEEIDFKWQVAMLTMRGKREYKASRNQGNRNKDALTRNAPVDTSTTNALVVQDGISGYDWSFQAEEELIKFALMAYTSQGGLTCLFAKATLDESNLWYRMLGHINFKTMNKLVRGNLARGLPSKIFENDHTYVTCQKGKQHKASCLENQIDHTVKIIRCDNGTEFKNRIMNEFCKMKGIRDRTQRNEFKSMFGQDMDANGNRMFTQDSRIFSGAYNDEVDDFNNLELTIVVSPIPTNRIQKDHPKEQIIRDPLLALQTRRMTKTSQEHVMVIQALKDPSWIEAMQDDLLQFRLQKVWRLVDLPKGKHAIGTKWVYRNKKDERGIVVRNKARWLHKVTPKKKELIMIRFIMYHMDVKSAFLYGTIKEEVNVCQPPGFEDPHFPNKVYKVEKPYMVFIKLLEPVQVYVEDIIFGSTKKSLCREFEGLMHMKFQMNSIRELIFFLGLQVMQKDDGIFISQDKYVADILKKFDFSSLKTASTPIETNKALLKDEEVDDVDVHLYISMIGSLMYLTASRPDIMFVVCACARFQVTPKVSHLHAVKRIFRYLKGQPKLGLWYPRDSPFNLEAFSDSDYAGASLDRKSRIRGCQFLRKRLISRSKNKEETEEKIEVPSPGSEIPTEEGVLNLEDAKTTQAKEIASLKKRVKKLEQKRKSRTSGLTRLRRVRTASRIESSTKASLGYQEDASKQERMIDSNNQDVEITLVDETQGRMNEEDMFGVNDLNGDEVIIDVTAGENVEQSTKDAEKEVSIVDPVTTASEVVTTADIEVITTATTPKTSKDELTLDQTLIEIKATKPKAITTAIIIIVVGTRPRAKGIVMQEPTQMQAELEEEKRLARLKEEETNIDLFSKWDNTQAMIDADCELAARLSPLDLFSNLKENSKEEVAETMAETKEQYMSKTLANYGSGIARPKIDDKDHFELKGQFLRELRDNTFSGLDNEDAHEHIKKVLEIVDLFYVLNITQDQIMLRVFPMSLNGASKTAFASNKPLYLLHMDLCGPMHVESINGKRYVLVVVDDYPRRNQTLVKAARTMLAFSNLPLFLWAEAIATACFTQNRLIIHKRFDKTPYELINKRKPNIKFFRVFGCRCYLLNDYEDVGKIKAKGDIKMFVGYSKESAAFRIYNK
nr:hypothetical protein [Tanacetum cinerariifolium]